ncbi:thermonuclease family protein [Planctomycetota bacterium]
MKRYLILILLIAGFLLVNGDEIKVKHPPGTYPKVMYANGALWEVASVVDGAIVKIKGLLAVEGNETTIRLIGVDTPETRDPGKPVKAYGKEASLFLKNLLKGEDVYLVTEPGRVKDKDGRALAYIFRAPDGMFINLEIVRQGYGYVDTEFPFKHMALFGHYENRAKELKKGLWEEEAVKGEPIEEPEPNEDGLTETEPAQTPEKKESAFEIVYKTKSGKEYHKDGCGYLEGKKRVFTSKKIATEEGLTPCKICKP